MKGWEDFEDEQNALAKAKKIMETLTDEPPFSDRGVIKRLKHRFVVMSTEYFTAGLMKDIVEFAGEEAAAAILYRGGYHSGKAIFRRYKELTGNDNMAIDLCTASAWYFGWGIVTIKVEKREHELIGHARIYKSFEAASYKNTQEFKNEKKCHFLRGVITGIMAEYAGKPYKGEEIMCTGEGAPYCEFVLMPLDIEEPILPL